MKCGWPQIKARFDKGRAMSFHPFPAEKRERMNSINCSSLMLTMITHKLADKIESYRLLAEAFDF